MSAQARRPIVGVTTVLAAASLFGTLGPLEPIQVVGGLAILAAGVIVQRAAPAGDRVVAAPAVEGETR